MKYVVSDIHGCYDKFMNLLELIKFSVNDELYIIGDVIDRGPEPIKLLQYIIDTPNIFLLKGNHEDMMFQCLINPNLSYEEREDLKFDPDIVVNRNLWVGYNGGEVTAAQYNKLSFKEQRNLYYTLRDLKNYEVIELDEKKFLLVHGGPTSSSIEAFDKSSGVLWERIKDTDFEKDLVPGYEIVVGHTPTFTYGEQYDGKIIKQNHKYLIDCGLVFGHKLGCLCLDTLAEYYI